MQNLLTALNNSQESLYVLLLIIITAIALFGLCGLSFMFGRKRDKHKSEFLKYWVFIPLWLLLLTCFIRLGQIITSRILPDSAFYPSASAVMASAWGVIGFGIVSELRTFIPMPKSNFFFSYLLSLLALVNIEIFSALHLPFVFIFTAEFIIIILSRYARKTWNISVFMVLMTIPLLPYLIPTLRNHTAYFITGPSYTPGWNSSFLLSCIVLPFLLQSVRILISQGAWHRTKGSILHNALTDTLLRTFLCFLIMIAVTLYVYLNPVPSVQNSYEDTLSTEGSVLVTYHTTDEYGITTHLITVTGSAPVIRYDITVFLPDDTAVLFSEQEYTLDADSVIHFTVDTPESDRLDFAFTTTVSLPGTVSVTALDNGFYRIPVEYAP